MNNQINSPLNSFDREQGKDTKSKLSISKSDLKNLLEKVGAATPHGEVNNLSVQASETTPPAQNFEQQKEVTAEWLLRNLIVKMPTLVEPILQQVGIAALVGTSDTGKSMVLRQLAITICANETHFLGFQLTPKHRSVIFVPTEDLEAETSFLLSKQAAQYKPEQLSGLRFIFDTTDLLQKLDESLTDKPADLVIIDCFADLYGQSLNDTQKIREFLNQYLAIARKHQCLVLFLHHTGKRTQNLEPSKDNTLGGQGFEGKMRLVIELRADQYSPTQRHLCIVKGNYLGAEYKKQSYVLDFKNDTLTFSNTGQRADFETLAKVTDKERQETNFEPAIQAIENKLNNGEKLEREQIEHTIMQALNCKTSKAREFLNQILARKERFYNSKNESCLLKKEGGQGKKVFYSLEMITEKTNLITELEF